MLSRFALLFLVSYLLVTMVPTDLPSKRRRKARLLSILTVLLAVNAGVAHLLVGQIGATGETKTSEVKEVQVTAQEVGRITAEDTIETIPPADEKPIITTYTVAQGDTLSTVAAKFDISSNTIRWANNLDAKATLKLGQKLIILPVTGIEYTVKNGDTLSGIATKFHGNQEEIAHFNEIENGKIKVGMKIIIPDGEPIAPAPKKEVVKASTTTKSTTTTKATTTAKVEIKSTNEAAPVSTSLAHPMPGSILTQGVHGYNSVDFGAPVGTPVYAANAGTVIVAKPTGYNGGYGSYVVIEHSNGTQTLYAHLSKVSVAEGDTVTKGERIGSSGNTGRSTGPHLHFEVRGGLNPWTKSSKGTKF